MAMREKNGRRRGKRGVSRKEIYLRGALLCGAFIFLKSISTISK
jgi:hypothetical protein